MIELYKGNADVVSQLTKIGRHNLATSDVTKAEMFYGARNKQEMLIIEKLLSLFAALSINEDVSSLAVALVRKYALSHKLDLPDALIAATAIYFQLSLFTLNMKDFRFIDGLTLCFRS